MKLFGLQNINLCLFTEVIWLAEAQFFSNYYTKKQSQWWEHGGVGSGRGGGAFIDS